MGSWDFQQKLEIDSDWREKMKQIAEKLTKKLDKVSQSDYQRVYQLYQQKKPELTLDGKKRVVISRLSSKFPIVSIAGTGIEAEYSFAAIEKVLNGSCKFFTK